jgi:hypothetical protein
MEAKVRGQGHAESPGSDGASPYLSPSLLPSSIVLVLVLVIDL